MGKIAILGFGGTIATHLNPVTQTREIKYSIQEIINRFESLQEEEIEAIDIRNIDSTEANELHWREIAEITYKTIQRKDIDGIVITHGTDTMSFTGSALSFAIQNLGKPIILTGSQRSLDELETDAEFNLINAVNLAKSNLSGVYICFGGLIILGTRAAKTRSSSYQAFESINHPYISPFLLRSPFLLTDSTQGTVSIDYTPPSRNNSLVPTFHSHFAGKIFYMDMFPNINLNLFIDWMIEQNYAGLVIKGYGLGNIPINMIKRLAQSDIKFSVILSTQTRYEGVSMHSYALGMQAKDSGIISARDMLPETAFVKLKWLVGKYMQEYELYPPFKHEMLKEDFHRPIAKEIR